MNWKAGTWANGRKRIKGRWCYNWYVDRFVISLDGCDPVTGLRRQPFEVSGDNPNFGRSPNKWMLIEEQPIRRAISGG